MGSGKPQPLGSGTKKTSHHEFSRRGTWMRTTASSSMLGVSSRKGRSTLGAGSFGARLGVPGVLLFFLFGFKNVMCNCYLHLGLFLAPCQVTL